MNPAQNRNAISTIRFMAVAIVAALGLYATAIICATLLRQAVVDASMYDLGALAIIVLLGGALVTAPFCLLVYHFFSLWGTTTLPKAIRLNEAMRLLHATTHKESIKVLRHHDINVYRSRIPLGKDATDGVPCKIISTFLSPLFFRSDRLNAFGSAYYCCDYDEIQSIIQAEQSKWGYPAQGSDSSAAQLAVLEKMNADLRQENKKVKGQYTSASGSAGRLKLQLEDVQKHMAVLIALAHNVTREVKPPRTLSREDIKRKYLAIGKLRGIETAPAAYVELFRAAMPKEYINHGGAPCQSGENAET